LGEFSLIGQLITWVSFSKITETARILGLLCSTVKLLCINFNKNSVEVQFGRFLHKTNLVTLPTATTLPSNMCLRVIKILTHRNYKASMTFLYVMPKDKSPVHNASPIVQLKNRSHVSGIHLNHKQYKVFYLYNCS
jgi:hypothetical protein